MYRYTKLSLLAVAIAATGAVAYAANGALIFGPAMAVASFASGLAYDALAPGGISEQTKLYWLMVAVTLGGLVLAWRASSRRTSTPA